MKILYLVHQFYPMHYTGTEKFILHMAMMMQKLGHKVKVVTYSFYEDLFYDKSIGNILFKEFLYNGIPVLAFKYKEVPEDLNYGLENEDLAKIAENLIADEKPDILHVGHPMRVSELIRVLKPLGIPYIITLTDFWLICPGGILSTSKDNLCAGPDKGNACRDLCPELSEKFIVHRLEMAKDILFNAELIVSPSMFVVSVFKKEFTDLNFRVIDHGVSYCKIKRNGRTYKEHDMLTFFYGGSLNPHKGVHVLVDAFARVSSGNTALKIYGSGSPAYVDALHEIAGDNGRIEFCGVFSDDQVGDILSNVDVTIVPSLWYENYPLVLHEALACNVPVIASNAGGMAEKIKDGVNGFLFEIGNSEHLREVLERLIDNPEKINVLKNNIKNLMIPTIEQEVYVYERCYKQALSGMLIGVP